MPRVFQYHASVIAADGIGNSIALLNDKLRAEGIDSYILCADSNHAMALPGVLPASNILNARFGKDVDENDFLLIHFSFFDPTAEKLASLPLHRVLVYHNITPAHFFRDVGQDHLADACDEGRRQLSRMSSSFDVAVGDSAFNCSELSHFGFKSTCAVPILLELSSFRNENIDPSLFLEVKRAAKVNVLFVGRFVPNKRVDRLIRTIAHYKDSFDSEIHLHLIGKIWNDDYFASIMNVAAEVGVVRNIRVHQDAEPLRLRTLYAAADAFVCMSDHEGFMIPIVEAFASGCPVIAADAGAIKETMGGAGLLLSWPDPAFAAGLVYFLATDRTLRNRIIAGQGKRLEVYRTERTTKRWLEIIRSLTNN